jgi:cytoskeletal protein CcmA (bactofilin family)
MFSKRTDNTTIIGRGARFNGTLELEGAVHIEGQCEGSIRAKGQLSVGANGSALGELAGSTVLVAGRVEGTVIASEVLHVLPTGNLKGEAFYQRLQVDPGGIIDGSSHQGPRAGSMLALEAGQDAVEAPMERTGVVETRIKGNSVRPLAPEGMRSDAQGRW